MANINALGLRGALPEQPRPGGRQRIVSLGDSAFYGFGVNDHEVFTHHLSSVLRKRGLDIDAINAGVSGYSIAQHRVLLDEFGWDLDPTLLLICNLWSDNTWDTFHDEDLIASRQFAARNPLTRSALVKLAAAWVAGLGNKDNGRVIVWNSSGEWPKDKVRRVPLDRWMQLTDGIMREASDRGIGVVLLKPTNSFLLEGLHNGPDPGWQPYFDAMEALAEHHGVPLIDVTAVYQAAHAEGTPYSDLLWDKMHPTAKGHALLAEAIAARLLEAGWPEKRMLARLDEYDGVSINDLPGPEWTDDAGAGSPQVNLFELSREHKKRMAENRAQGAAMAEQPGPAEGTPRGPIGAPVESEQLVSARTAWAVGIDIEGGHPPYQIKLLDPEARTIGSARVGKAGPLKLNVRGEVTTVTVVIRDGEGQTSRQDASPDAASVSLKLGG